MSEGEAVPPPLLAVVGANDSAVAATPVAAPPKPSVRKPAPPSGQSKRQEFLSGLLNEDLQKLSRWHYDRPQHEQKRFLRTVDALYKEFSKEASGASSSTRAAPPPRPRPSQALPSVLEDDELRSSTPRGQPPTQLLGASASEPSLPSTPIEVFEQRRRAGVAKRAVREEGFNSLEAWMEGASVSSVFSVTTASTRASGKSNITLTTSSGASSLGGQKTTTQSAFVRPKHVRLLGNKRTQRGCAHIGSEELKDGLANMGFPERERFRTNFTDTFGRAALAESLPPEACNKVIQDSQMPFVKSYLEGAPSQQKAQFGNAIRSLQSLRRMGKGSLTQQKEAFDTEENTRLWMPARATPLPAGMHTRSQVPLGGASLTAASLKGSGLSQQLPTIDKVSASLGMPPPSPSVSNLSSLPLSPVGSSRGF